MEKDARVNQDNLPYLHQVSIVRAYFVHFYSLGFLQMPAAAREDALTVLPAVIP